MESSIFKKIWSEINPATSRSMSPALIIVYAIEIIIFNSLNPLFLTLKNYQIMGNTKK